MAKALIRRYLPDPERIRELRALGPLRHRLGDPALWYLNRRSAARATFWGLLCAFLPMPMQSLPAAIAAIATRSNLPLSIVLVWVSNPLTAVPQLYGGWWLGSHLLHQDGPDLAHIRQMLGTDSGALLDEALGPLLLGMPLIGLILGAIGYVGMQVFWRWQVSHAWQQRRTRHPDKPQP